MSLEQALSPSCAVISLDLPTCVPFRAEAEKWVLNNWVSKDVLSVLLSSL